MTDKTMIARLAKIGAQVRLADLKKEEQQLQTLLGGPGANGKRSMSPEMRLKMSKLMKARWKAKRAAANKV